MYFAVPRADLVSKCVSRRDDKGVEEKIEVVQKTFFQTLPHSQTPDFATEYAFLKFIILVAETPNTSSKY